MTDAPNLIGARAPGSAFVPSSLRAQNGRLSLTLAPSAGGARAELEGSTMKSIVLALAAGLAGLAPAIARAETNDVEAVKVERLRDAMKDARWTGPLLASTPETLPAGH